MKTIKIKHRGPHNSRSVKSQRIKVGFKTSELKVLSHPGHLKKRNVIFLFI